MMLKKIAALLMALVLMMPATAAMATLQKTTANGSMTIGTTGDEVLTAESALQSLGYFIGTPDSTYDAVTAAAVRAFQKENGLAQDGKIGSKTWARLTGMDGIAAVSKPAVESVDAKTTTGLSTNGSMVIGSKGAGVIEVQNLLASLGYYTSLVDGKYNSVTAAAVKRFQSRNGLTADGKVGAKTLAALRSGSAIAADSDTQNYSLNGSLELGSSGDAVKTLQEKLQALGYYKGAINSVFDAATLAAVQSFQSKNGLSADGKVGYDTINKLENAYNIYLASGNTTGLTAKGSLKLGSYGSKVTQVKNRLTALEYYTGVIDQTFDSDLLAAVKAFQIRNGLTVDGIVGTKTWNVMFSSDAVKKSDVLLPTLSRFSSNVASDVAALQNILFKTYFFNGSCDGIYGADTETAVKAFQAAAGLTVDGKAGNETRQKLTSVSAAQSAVVWSPVRTLNTGDRGYDVYLVQQRLVDLNYLSSSAFSKGVFDSATSNAITRFQNDKKINVTGSYNSTVRRYLWVTGTDAEQQEAIDKIFQEQNAYDQENIPYNGDTLKVGSTGSQVATAQMRLKAGGWLLGSADGVYGESTRKAVLQFQKDYNKAAAEYNKAHQSDENFVAIDKIKEDGIIGSDTWSALWNFNNLKNAEQTVVIDGATSVGANIIVMQRGSKGSQVVKLQTRLKELGLYNGEIDGKYGPATALAVSKFQQANNLKVDGKVGTQTLVAMQLGYDDSPVTLPTATPLPDDYDYTQLYSDTTMPSSLKEGSKGNSVIKLQKALAAQGYYSGKQDGVFGTSTKLAVMEFQVKYNEDYKAAHPDESAPLPTNGVADSATLAALGLKSAATPSTSKLKVGSTGDMVKTLQQKLKDQGLYSGAVDGVFDTTVEAAVKKFQKDNKLKVDGIVGNDTWKALTGTTMSGESASSTSTAIMKRGSKGANVTQLQKFLIAKGYLSEKNSEGASNADGKFGINTAVAVMKFQTAAGIEKVDGIVGEQTYAAMKEQGLLSY